MPLNGSVTEYDDNGFAQPATRTAAVASGVSTNTVVKATAGRLAKVIVTGQAGTTTGTTVIYDSASAAAGTPLLTLPNNAAVGTIYSLDSPVAAGVTVGGGANAPALTFGLS